MMSASGYRCASGVPTLLRTIRSVRACPVPAPAIALLPDGPDEEAAAQWRRPPSWSGLPRWGTPDRQGTAACFNRLVAHTDARVVILLESGALVTGRWWELLLAALGRPGCGIAGPSTDRRAPTSR